MFLGRWKLASGVLAAVAALGGCAAATGSDSGALVVPYDFGKSRDCTTMGVQSVRAELNSGEMVEASCKRGRVRFDALEPGAYTVVMYGLDANGTAVVDSLSSGPVPVDVVGGNARVVVDPPIQLVPAPAKLKLRWTFGFGSCQSDEIDGFTVTAWHIDGTTELVVTNLPCATPGDRPERYRLVPDLGRTLAGEQLGAVDVQAYDESALAIGDRVAFSFAPPGPGGEILLSIRCDEGGCQGSGEPDPPAPLMANPFLPSPQP
jgi:hypothetical protein